MLKSGSLRLIGGAIVLTLLLGWWLFGDALWGRSLLAPLDIAPTLFTHFKHVAPAAGVIPVNHHLIDQLGYDLPLQHTIYRAYQNGVLPWWDPYTYGGRPLLAEAHCNGTDPVRLLCYALLPFELAYNWTKILHCCLAVAGMFLLLRHWGNRVAVAGPLAIAFGFSGGLITFWGHPWIQASFLYYPLLWWTWDVALTTERRWPGVVGPLLVAAILFSGNLQSHSYLPVFCGVFLLGYGGRSFPKWKRGLRFVVPAVLLGLGLAAPVWLPQVEAYRLSQRPLYWETIPGIWLSGLASLGGFFPWALGTHRSVDLSKVCSGSLIGFRFWIGSVAFVLAFLGCCRRPLLPRVRTGLGLVIVYLVILSVPALNNVLYNRCAGLGVLGLTILAAEGCRLDRLSDRFAVRLGLGIVAATVLLAATLQLAAFLVYPRLEQQVRAAIERRDVMGAVNQGHVPLREFQLRNLPNEISYRNPETIIAMVGLLVLGTGLASARARQHRLFVPTVLVLNVLPLLMFAHRFIPRQPVELWHRLEAGGPEQQRVATVLARSPLRLDDAAPRMHDKLFPYALSHLYQVRTVHGYSSIQPASVYLLSPEERQRRVSQIADYSHRDGALQSAGLPHWSRFQWSAPTARALEVHDISLNEIRLQFTPGPPAVLLWTDTFYPGWRAVADGRNIPLSFEPPCFSTIEVPAGVQQITLRYRPTHWQLGLGCLAVSVFVLGGMTSIQFGSRRR